MSTAPAKRKQNKEVRRQKNASSSILSTVLPAVLVAIISIAAVGTFAPDAPYAAWTALARATPFGSKEVKLSSTPFDVVDIPGRGKGVIANRAIKARLVTFVL
ncbi:SET domain protein [Ceratobasidium sp. AG-Ba]|nr:SET domain protein [Ceratobasidium sp. AG-Ba]QRW03659.1 SET domain protein [Ceratobasidium sp. AG-Ba]